MYINYINAFYNGGKIFFWGGGELYLALDPVWSMNQSLSSFYDNRREVFIFSWPNYNSSAKLFSAIYKINRQMFLT